MLERVLHAATVVYNGVGLPIENGAVLTSGPNIAAFGKLEELRRAHPDARVEAVGRAILPPPVNAHTHLDLTGFPYRELPYHDWIPWLVGHRRANPGLRGLELARRGLEAVRASGVGAMGDLTNQPEVVPFMLERGELPGVVYWEVLDPNPDTAEETFQATVERVRAWRRLEQPGGMRLGLSPHAPFTVSSVLLKKLSDFARLEGLPLQIHVAESPFEPEMFRTGGGPLAESFGRFGALPFEVTWGRSPNSALTPVSYLADLGVLGARPTLVHMVNVTEDDVRTVAQAGCAVVHCPRSNRALQCGTFPWALYARHGVEVGLGTDSIASGGTLSVFDEMEAALALHGPAAGLRSIVRAAVKGGHRALGSKPPVTGRGEPFSSLRVWR